MFVQSAVFTESGLRNSERRKLLIVLSVIEAGLYISFAVKSAKPIVQAMLNGTSWSDALVNNLDLLASAFVWLLGISFSIFYFRSTPSARLITQLTDSAIDLKLAQRRITRSSQGAPLSRRPAQSEINTAIQAYIAATERSGKLVSSTLFQAGAYLVAGGLLAFFGLIAFYASIESISPPKTWNEYVFVIGPKAGMLFFVEFMAVLFLGLHRTALQSYRHFESILRRREECLTILKFMQERDHRDINGYEFLLAQTLSELPKEDSTPHDVALLKGITDVVAAARGK